MTPNEQSALIRLAREAGCSETWGADSFRFTIEELQRFAELWRNEVLDEAAKSCNELIEADNSDDYKAGVTWCAMRIEGLKS